MDQRVVIADILRSRGNRGEVLAESLTDVPGRLENLKQATVRFADGDDSSVTWKNLGPMAGIGSLSLKESIQSGRRTNFEARNCGFQPGSAGNWRAATISGPIFSDAW